MTNQCSAGSSRAPRRPTGEGGCPHVARNTRGAAAHHRADSQFGIPLFQHSTLLMQRSSSPVHTNSTRAAITGASRVELAPSGQQCYVVRNLSDWLCGGDCRAHLRRDPDAHTDALDCGRWAGVGWNRNSDGGQSYSPERLRNLRSDAEAALQGFLRRRQQEIQNETEMDMWLTVRNRPRHPAVGTDFGVHRTSAPASPLRAPWAGSRSGLCLGRRLLGPAGRPLSVGSRAMGPSAL
jgi:hypothetical protein